MCVAFSENGYLLASGTEDGGANITDLRKLKCTKTLECKYMLSLKDVMYVQGNLIAIIYRILIVCLLI